MITRLLAILLAATFATAATADAQYFGRNKVQYEKFDFKILATEHFDIYYYPEEEQAVQLAARMAERWYARLSRLLRHDLSGRQPLVLYAAHPHFQQTNVLPGEIGEGTGGVTEMLRRRIIMPFAGGLAETDHVLGHELVHAFQFDMASRVDAEGNLVGPAVLQLPLWFIEGMAEYLSIGPVDANTAMWVREASSREAMPTVDKLNDPNFFPYRYGHAFWAYLAGRWGDAAVGDMLRATGPQGDISGALQAVLNVDKDTFTRDWHEATRRTYAPWIETTRPANTFGRAAITRETSGGGINVSPAISPDGRRVVFLSERSLFSIDMYLADLATGRVLRKLTETAGSAHFESLEFLQSAGDWAPDNRRFVFSALAKGQPVLAIVDTETGRREAEHEFPDIDQIFNPAWAPDGRRIAFSALRGGVLDLYLFDLESRQLTPLTNDPFADHDPEWAPDGRSIAWVTDRFSADIATLQFGTYRLGLLDVTTRAARPLGGFGAGRHTNPEFAADGRSIYFIGTPDGIPNIYRLSVDGGEPTPVTNILSGVSGITPMTPALSVAAAATAYVFTIFENDRYNLYTAGETTAAARVLADADRNAAVLPPAVRTSSSDVAQLLASPATGLPQPTTYEQRDYAARLSLLQVGQPTVGIGADRFGAYAGGGLSFLFSDMLGNHELGATFNATSRLQEFGGALGYINRTRRWNFGVVGEVNPYVTGAFAQGFTGDGTFVQESYRVIQRNTAVTGLVQYPFSRAHRVEFATGARHIGFSQRVERQVFSPTTGQLLQEETQDLPSPDGLTFAQSSAALVYDSSTFGATSPILGQRYRFELSQTAGTLTYTGALADFRRYFMPVRPFTLAIRGLHYGRYGRDGEDGRLGPMYLGFPGLVRGYEVESFDATECETTGASMCAAFDELVGSRIAIASAELRAPLFGLFSRSTLYGPLPIELALFADAGVAWTSDSRPAFAGGERDGARSVGAAIRMNLFGYAIGELDYVRALDRNRGWQWQFSLSPGF